MIKIEDIAKFAGISTTTVEIFVKNGDLTSSLDSSGELVFDAAEVREFLVEHTGFLDKSHVTNVDKDNDRGVFLALDGSEEIVAVNASLLEGWMNEGIVVPRVDLRKSEGRDLTSDMKYFMTDVMKEVLNAFRDGNVRLLSLDEVAELLGDDIYERDFEEVDLNLLNVSMPVLNRRLDMQTA